MPTNSFAGRPAQISAKDSTGNDKNQRSPQFLCKQLKERQSPLNIIHA
jgi:hypothetical protein